MTEDKLIQMAISGSLRLNHIDSYREERKLTREEVFNSLTICVARKFHSQSLSYEDADTAANLIWSAMLDDSVEHGNEYRFAQPAYDIYEAFDEGEYDHRDGENPVEKYTKQRIREILEST